MVLQLYGVFQRRRLSALASVLQDASFHSSGFVLLCGARRASSGQQRAATDRHAKPERASYRRAAQKGPVTNIQCQVPLGSTTYQEQAQSWENIAPTRISDGLLQPQAPLPICRTDDGLRGIGPS